MAVEPRLTAVVLAAGQGKRLRSATPKVLHRAAGRPLLSHVLAAVAPLSPVRTIVVAPRAQDGFAAAIGATDAAVVVQDPPAGTGDALRVALEHAGEELEGTVLVASGDSPLVRTTTFGDLVGAQSGSGAACVVLTAELDRAEGYGRIVRSGDGDVERIVEEADATEEERRIREVNGGAYAFAAEGLVDALAQLDRENAQAEYYLTDLVALLRSGGKRVRAHVADADEIHGVNTRRHLAEVSRVLHRRTCDRWMDEGVTIVDPDTTYIDATVRVAPDAIVQPFTFLEGETSIGEGAEIGPQARIVDSEIGPGASVSFAVVRESLVGPRASVGPFASLRAGTALDEGSKIGTFVETKKTSLGRDSKANHLAYLGDARIGTGVNVGAGTITCNWDGREKHETVIEDDAYIGSDTMLVAPTRIGKRAATGAGSVVRGDVPEDGLAVGVPARIIEGRGDKMGKREGEGTD